MRQDDFFEWVEVYDGLVNRDVHRLNNDVIQAAWHGALPDSDLEVVRPLTRIVRDEFTVRGTSGSRSLNEEELSICRRALQAIARRLGYELNIPFSDEDTFREYWKREGAANSYQARRDILSNIFDPLERHIEYLENLEIDGGLAFPVSPKGRTGWYQIDKEVRELRTKFSSARTDADYSDVGNRAVRILEELSRVAFDGKRHMKSEDTPENFLDNHTKNRLERVIEIELPSSNDGTLRSFARKSVALSQEVKHSKTPSRKEAGIVADTVIMLVNLIRRLVEDSGADSQSLRP